MGADSSQQKTVASSPSLAATTHAPFHARSGVGPALTHDLLRPAAQLVSASKASHGFGVGGGAAGSRARSTQTLFVLHTRLPSLQRPPLSQPPLDKH
jgi:hypothetical protein